MTKKQAPRPYTLELGDKVTAIAVYTQQSLLLGELVTRNAVRVSTWLRTSGLPDYIALYQVTMLRFVGIGEPQILRLPTAYVPTVQVIALHLTPPGSEPIDFDPAEPNRKFEPMTALAGSYRFEGSLRMPANVTLAKQMETHRESFTMLYNVTASSAYQPMGTVQSSMVMVRSSACTFIPGKPG